MSGFAGLFYFLLAGTVPVPRVTLRGTWAMSSAGSHCEPFLVLVTGAQRMLYAFIFRLVPEHGGRGQHPARDQPGALEQAGGVHAGDRFSGLGLSHCPLPGNGPSPAAIARPLDFRRRTGRAAGPPGRERLCALDNKRELLLECLRKLSDSQRQLLDNHYANRLSGREIAERTGRKANAVFQSLHRTRETLLRLYRTGSDETRRQLMAADTSQFEELGRLIAALLDGGLEAAERRRLEDMLLSDPAAVAYYQDYLDVHVLLHWQQGLAEEQPACGGSGTRDEGPVAEGLSPASAGGRPIHPSSFILHPFVVLESLAGSAVLSYLVAVVLLGAGVLLAGAWQTGIDRSSLARAKAEAAKGTIGAPVFVARITKAQDCYREDGGPWDADGLLCRLGFQCYVKAGELEITYNTGTKVTLQGPAVYEVSAVDGGSLFEGSAAISVKAHKGVLPVKEAVTAKEIASHPLFKLRAGRLANEPGGRVQPDGR